MFADAFNRLERLPVWACLVLAVILTAGPLETSTGSLYFVATGGEDSNPGTSDRPWRHIGWAMTRPFLKGGDVIRVRGGVYESPAVGSAPPCAGAGGVAIRPVASGQPGLPITVMAELGQAVTLTGSCTTGGWQPSKEQAEVYFYEYAGSERASAGGPYQVVEDGRLLPCFRSLFELHERAGCVVDPDAGKVYLRTSDGRSPATHRVEMAASLTGVEFRNGVSYWRLSGFAVSGFRTAGIMIHRGAGHIEIESLDISRIGSNVPGADRTRGYAIAVYDTSGGNWIHGNNLHGTLAEAVHVSQTGAGEDIYEDNEFHHNGGREWGVDPGKRGGLIGPGMIVRGNKVTVRRNRFYSNGYHGLILESDWWGSEGPSHPSENRIEENVFAFNLGNAIYLDGKNGQTSSTGNVICRNLFLANNHSRAGSSRDGALRLAGNFDSTLISNNTFYGENANSVVIYGMRGQGGGAQGGDAIPHQVYVVNNIAIQRGEPAGVYPLSVSGSRSGFRAEANDWWCEPRCNPIRWDGRDFSTIREFAHRTGNERHGVSLDPHLQDPGTGRFGLRPDSPAIGRGLAAGSLTKMPGWRAFFRGALSPDLGACPVGGKEKIARPAPLTTDGSQSFLPRCD